MKPRTLSRTISMLLTITLLIGMTGILAFAEDGASPLGISGRGEPELPETTGTTITAFAPLSKAVMYQNVPAKTPLSALVLPETLAATGTTAKPANPTAITVENITWQPKNEYDDTAETGLYVFTAELPEGYSLEAGVTLPEIYVTVGTESQGGIAAQYNIRPYTAVTLRTITLDLTNLTALTNTGGTGISEGTNGEYDCPDEGWTWYSQEYYDATSTTTYAANTLVLDGADINVATGGSSPHGIILPGGSTIIAEGTNFVRAASYNSGNSYGFSVNGSLTFKDGKLNVRGGLNSQSSYGIKCNDLIIESGFLQCEGSDAVANSYGVDVDGSITVNAGATLMGYGSYVNSTYAISRGVSSTGPIEVKGGTLEGMSGEIAGCINTSIGIWTKDALTVENGGRVTGNSGISNSGDSYGVFVENGISIEGENSFIIGQGGEAKAQNRYCIGVYCIGDLSVKDGSISGIGGMVSAPAEGNNANSIGILVSGDVTVENAFLYGDVLAQGASPLNRSTGINITNGSLTVKGQGAEVSANVISPSSYSCGVSIMGDLTIEDRAKFAANSQANGNGSSNEGVRVSNDINVTGGGNLRVASGVFDDDSGLYSDYHNIGIIATNIYVEDEGSAIIAESGKAVADGAFMKGVSFCVNASDKIIASNGGKVYGRSGDAVLYSFGINVYGDYITNGIEVSGESSLVYGESGEASGNGAISQGIAANKILVTDEGFIRGESGAAPDNGLSRGISADGRIDIDGRGSVVGGFLEGAVATYTFGIDTPEIGLAEGSITAYGATCATANYDSVTEAVNKTDIKFDDKTYYRYKTSNNPDPLQNLDFIRGNYVWNKSHKYLHITITNAPEEPTPEDPSSNVLSTGSSSSSGSDGNYSTDIKYSFISGANREWQKGSISSHTVEVDASYTKFYSVYMDDLTVGDTNWTAKSGSTIVTLKPEYLETLSLGKHTLRIRFSDGYAETNLTILAKQDTPPKTENPNTVVNNPFTDVRESDWFFNAVMIVYEQGLFAGTSATTFSPNAPMTRGMFLTVLARLDGADLSGYNMSPFDDVEITEYYGRPIAWATDKGIVTGVGNGKFAPDKSITREEMAVMMYNYIQKTGKNLPATLNLPIPFADEADISPWAKEAVSVMQAYGLINGGGGNRYNPQGTATRAEVAQIFLNYLNATAE